MALRSYSSLVRPSSTGPYRVAPDCSYPIGRNLLGGDRCAFRDNALYLSTTASRRWIQIAPTTAGCKTGHVGTQLHQLRVALLVMAFLLLLTGLFGSAATQ